MTMLVSAAAPAAGLKFTFHPPLTSRLEDMSWIPCPAAQVESAEEWGPLRDKALAAGWRLP